MSRTITGANDFTASSAYNDISNTSLPGRAHDANY